MEEKRKHKRLDLDVTVQLERLDKDGVTTLKYVHVDITDLSRSGIGFKASQPLEVGTYYDTKLTIWILFFIFHKFIIIFKSFFTCKRIWMW